MFATEWVVVACQLPLLVNVGRLSTQNTNEDAKHYKNDQRKNIGYFSCPIVKQRHGDVNMSL